MTSKRSFLGKETVKEDVLNQEESTIPGAAHVINGNCKRKRKGSALNVERKLRNRSHHRGTNGHHKVKMAGFAAFSADYHVPKSHPPRNNWRKSFGVKRLIRTQTKSYIDSSSNFVSTFLFFFPFLEVVVRPSCTWNMIILVPKQKEI